MIWIGVKKFFYYVKVFKVYKWVWVKWFLWKWIVSEFVWFDVEVIVCFMWYCVNEGGMWYYVYWKGENSGNLKVGIKSNEVGDFFKK